MFRRMMTSWLCLGLIVMGSSVFATQVRIDSMGGGFKYWTVDDETNVFDFPSLIVHWGDMVLVDNFSAGSGTTPGENTRFAFHYGITDNIVIGVYGGRIGAAGRAPSVTAGTLGSPELALGGFNAAGNAFTGSNSLAVGGQASQAAGATHPSAGQGTSGAMTVSGDALWNVDLKMGLLFGMKVANMRFGVMLNILGDNADQAQPDDNTQSAQSDQGAMLIDIGLGFGVDLSPTMALELGAGLEFGMLEDYRDIQQIDTNGAPVADTYLDQQQQWSAAEHFGLRVNGRFIAGLSDSVFLIAYAQALIGSQEVEHKFSIPTAPVNGSWSAFNVAAGADLRLTLFDKVHVIPGIGFRYAQQSLEGAGDVDRDLDRLISLPYYGVGVEVTPWDWLALRFGAQQYVNMYRYSSTPASGFTVELHESDVLTSISTGIGLRLPIETSTLSLDIHVDPSFWLNGPFIATGASTNPFGLSAAMKYDW